MPVARSADGQKCRHQRALETGPDSDADARKQRERELAQERKRCHRSRLAALSGSHTIHTYVPENMVVDVPEDDNRSVVFPVQDFHLEQF